MAKPNLASLGSALDRAERDVAAMMAADRGTYFASPDSVPFDEYVRLMKVLHDAKLAYVDALTERNEAAKARFAGRTSRLNQRDGKKLRDRQCLTEYEIDLFEDLGPDFYTKRDFFDALAAYQLADWMWERAQRMFNNQQRRDRADKRAGIIRR